MVHPLPKDNLFLLATVVVLCVSIMCPLAVGKPLTSNTDAELKSHCSSNLADAINIICGGRTRSLTDNYPQSFGRRVKRDEIFYKPQQYGPTHKCCQRPCGITELRQYCAPD
ncbi:probable insulin-like peptide 6 [Scaptodrosophila lebanonensis]|uniref:Probable insulin-like peptide 6 n=1 Tax=Drosophila lebanonensis TaxID=7225 RepID=A0A6J2UEA0_DROLE|nr:probable insulin-like peptide 6 [Scaptodrosophila lebanonensis]